MKYKAGILSGNLNGEKNSFLLQINKIMAEPQRQNYENFEMERDAIDFNKMAVEPNSQLYPTFWLCNVPSNVSISILNFGKYLQYCTGYNNNIIFFSYQLI